MIQFRDDLPTRATSNALLKDLWVEEVRAGRILIPAFVTDEWAQAIGMALNLRRADVSIELVIDCKNGGDVRSFEPCTELLRRRNAGLHTIGTVVGHAQSIGLSYLVVCTHRRAMPEARFMAHGEGRRVAPRHESGVYQEDFYAADWLQRFTKRTYDEWLAYMGDGDTHEFGVAEALEWGVIDEVMEGV